MHLPYADIQTLRMQAAKGAAAEEIRNVRAESSRNLADAFERGLSLAEVRVLDFAQWTLKIQYHEPFHKSCFLISTCPPRRGLSRLTDLQLRQGSADAVVAMAQDMRRDAADAVHKTARAATAELAAEVARRKQAEQKLIEVCTGSMHQPPVYVLRFDQHKGII